MFLQDLRSAIMAITLEYNSAKQSKQDVAAVEIKLNALNEIWQYVKSGLWTDNPETAHRVAVLTMRDRETAIKELGLNSRDHARMIVSRANKILDEKFGSNFINNLLASGDKLSDMMIQFRINSGTLLSTGTFLSEAFAMLPPGDNTNKFRLGDCINEVKLLTFYSKAIMGKRFAAVDKEKLAYLVYLLNTYEPALQIEQKALYNVIVGEASPNELTEIVNPLNPLYDKPSTM